MTARFLLTFLFCTCLVHASRAAEPPSGAKDQPAPTAPPAGEAKPAATKAGGQQQEAPTVLPKMEVRNSRIVELDLKIRALEADIAREKKKIKPTEADSALNSPEISQKLSLFGGKSAKQREAVAAERVDLMEAERDILEAMKQARSKEEAADLQLQIDSLKAVRRDLEDLLR